MAAMPQRVSANGMMVPEYQFISLIDKYGIRFSRIKHSVYWFRDDGEFRTICFQEYLGNGGPTLTEFSVKTTYEEIQKALGKP